MLLSFTCISRFIIIEFTKCVWYFKNQGIWPCCSNKYDKIKSFLTWNNICWKVHIMNFSEMANTVFSKSRRLMERWFLLGFWCNGMGSYNSFAHWNSLSSTMISFIETASLYRQCSSLDQENDISLAPEKWAFHQTLWTILPPTNAKPSYQTFETPLIK